MSAETPASPAEPRTADARTAVTQRYTASSGVAAGPEGDALNLAADASRDPVQFDATLKDAVRVREALSALHAVVQSDLRYVPKDRTAYQAWRRMKQQASSLDQWAAQRAYFDWLARNDPGAWMVLDPIVTVQPDAVLFEVFSKDEGTYAQLSVNKSAFKVNGEVAYGTTNVDFSDALFDGVQRMRSYRSTRLTVGSEAVNLETAEAPPVTEKRIAVPDAWLRGFLQVQSAATLADTVVHLAPMDLYNALRHLRLNADQKRKGRGLRFELVPGEAPRLVLEPWETVLESGGAPFAGRRARVMRIWGRRRLMLLRRILPFAESVEVHLLGSALPSFWVLRCGSVTFTLGMTGFTGSDWAAALGFDVLLPRPTADTDADVTAVLTHLDTARFGKPAAIAKATKLNAKATRAALQAACQRGQVMFDVAAGVYRRRPLTGVPLDPLRLAYRSDREKQAHDLLATKDAVKITREAHHPGEGVEITGQVTVAADGRSYRVSFLVDDEGRVRKADDTSPFFRKHKLSKGPSAPLIALRMAHAQFEAKRAANRGKARGRVQVETRTYSQRHPKGEMVYQVALDRTRIKVRWGERSEARPRVQQQFFDSVADARAAYFARVDDLETRGFLDASAG
jgi:hypothetical protein